MQKSICKNTVFKENSMENIDDSNNNIIKEDNLENISNEKEDSNYYSLEELAGIDNIENIDQKRIPPLLLEYAKSQVNNQDNISKTEEYNLGYEEIKEINDTAKKMTEKVTGETFNISDITHKDYFEKIKQELQEEKIREQKSIQLNNDLMQRYGSEYETLEKEARNVFENMSFRDASALLTARHNGDTKTVLDFYDKVYISMKNRNIQFEQNRQYPPKSIYGSDTKSQDKKDLSWNNFI